MNKLKLLVIVGPTAVGKSKLAVQIAKKINGEIVSADSMQVYKKMNIATAKLSMADQMGIAHHLVDCVNLNSNFSVVDYVKMARRSLKEIVAKNKRPILVGGTGLYVDSLLNEFEFDERENCEKIRANLMEEFEKHGAVYMFEKLKKIDFNYANKLHPNNFRRVIRALEVFYSTGRTMSDKVKLNKEKTNSFECLKIGLNFLDRQKLYSKINNRIDFMLEQGLLKEANEIFTLSDGNCKCTAMQAIGYKEFVDFFLGKENLDDAVLKLKKNTRHLAKRQLTWFKRDKEINWFFVDEIKEIQLFNKIMNFVNSFFNLV